MQIPLSCLPQSNTRNPLDKISRLFKKILPIYWAFLTYMLLRPGMENLEFPFMFDGIDKFMHLSIFAVLGFCFMAAFPKIRFIYYVEIMLIYSFLTEILQAEMGLGRSLEILDLLADTAGFFLGYVLFKRIRTLTF